MVFAHLRSSAGLADRIFAKLANISTQPQSEEAFPFAAAPWPQGQQENTKPVLQFSSALPTPLAVESKSELNTLLKAQLKAQIKAELKAELKSELKSEPTPAAEWEPKAELKPVLELVPKAELKPVLELLPKSEARPALELVPKTEPKSAPKTESYSAPKLQLPSVQSKTELKWGELPKSTVPPLQQQQLGEFQIPSREIFRASRVVEVQRRHVDLVNQRQPFGCHVMAWSMIPAEIWQGANATFMMMACDFFHTSAPNSLLLPVTRKGADHLKLPQYPFHAARELIEAARAEVSKIRQAFAAEHLQVLQAMQRGDMSAMSNRPARKKKFADDLKSLAHRLAAAQFGKNIMQDHQTAFGDALNYETPQPL